MAFDLEATSERMMLSARVTGAYRLPYERIVVELPANERRPLALAGEGIVLIPASAAST